MGHVLPIFRAVVTSSLLVSVGLAGICPCGADGAGRGLRHQASHATHKCPCYGTGHCCCGAACHCGQQAPQKDNEPAVPSPSNDRCQPLGLPADRAAFTGTTIAACQAGCGAMLLTGGNFSLVAQGTRLNC